MLKTNQPQTMDKFSELVDHSAELCKHKHYKDNETNESSRIKVPLPVSSRLHNHQGEQGEKVTQTIAHITE